MMNCVVSVGITKRSGCMGGMNGVRDITFYQDGIVWFQDGHWLLHQGHYILFVNSHLILKMVIKDSNVGSPCIFVS